MESAFRKEQYMSKRTGEKVSKVDYRLLYKRRIVDFLETIKDSKQTISQMNKSMEKLFSMGDYVLPVCISKLKENDATLAPVICYALEFADDYTVIEPLLDILKMYNISDQIKARILTVLSHYGIDARDLPLDIIIKDFDKIAVESLEDMLDDIDNDYFLIPYILDDLEEFTPQMKVIYVKDIGNLRNEKAINLLEILVMTDDVLVAQEAARALGKIKSSKSLNTLNRLSKFTKNEKIKDTVLREARRLKFCGVLPKNNVHKLKLGKPTKIVISSIDGLGNRALWFAWNNPIRKDKLVTMNLLLNTETGVSDCWCVSQISPEYFKLSVDDLAKTAIVAECDLEYALCILCDALYCSHKKQRKFPYQFYFWKYLLEQEYNLNPENYRPKLKEIPASCDKMSIQKTFELFNYNIFQDWFISDPRVYDYADCFKSKYGYSLKKMPYKKMDFIFSNFTEELIKPRVKTLKRMLKLTADFAEKLGQREIAQVTLVAAESLELTQLCYHPFIRRMIIESLKVAIINMKNGFDMRLTPEAFYEF